MTTEARAWVIAGGKLKKTNLKLCRFTTYNVLNTKRINDTKPNEPTNEAIYSSHDSATKTMCDVFFDCYCN